MLWMSSPNLFARRVSSSTDVGGNKKMKIESSNNNLIVVYHVKPSDGTDKTLELMVFHAANGNYAKNPMSFAFFKRNDCHPPVAIWLHRSFWEYLVVTNLSTK